MGLNLYLGKRAVHNPETHSLIRDMLDTNILVLNLKLYILYIYISDILYLLVLHALFTKYALNFSL